MLAGGIAFRGSIHSAEPNKGHDVYNGENIVGLGIQGEPQVANVDLAKVDDASLWQFRDILPARGFAFPQVFVCPTATPFDPTREAFTNTATLLFPRDDLAEFPFDMLVLSRS